MLLCSGCRLFRAPVPNGLGDLKKAADLNLLPAERGRLLSSPVDPISEGPLRRRSHNLLDDLFQFLATRKFSLLLTSIHGATDYVDFLWFRTQIVLFYPLAVGLCLSALWNDPSRARSEV